LRRARDVHFARGITVVGGARAGGDSADVASSIWI